MNKIEKIQLASTDQCTGCSACASICPTKSITMREDKEGFLQPHIDTDTCIKCHKCEKTCPIISPISIPTDFETQAFAAINKDDAVRMRSSSGGMFHALAKWTIEQGGAVFGARFNDQWEVVHDYTESIEGIEPFMRSKYVQSRIGDTFKQAKQFLDQGRQVLFVGTPCQIGGLKSYLKKDYENLLAVDIICHGASSPKVWRESLKDTLKGDTLLDFNFRDKQNGWKGFECVITTSAATQRKDPFENPYFRGFLKDVYQRPSCYTCKFRGVHRIADVTLADAWGIPNYCPEMDDNKGTSLLLLHTLKSTIIIDKILAIKRKSLSLEDPILYNPSLIKNMDMPRRRSVFFRVFSICGFHCAQIYIDKDAYYVRIIRKIKKILNKFKSRLLWNRKE